MTCVEMVRKLEEGVKDDENQEEEKRIETKWGKERNWCNMPQN